MSVLQYSSTSGLFSLNYTIEFHNSWLPVFVIFSCTNVGKPKRSIFLPWAYWWRLFKKRNVCSKFDIYFFI